MFATFSKSEGILTLYSTPPSCLHIPTVDSLFSMPRKGGQGSIFGITPDFSIVHIYVVITGDKRTLLLHSQNSLPLTSPPKMILPVDPMAWRSNNLRAEHDVLLSVSALGELAFWIPEGGLNTTAPQWRCTGEVRTGRNGISMARCSSAKKTALSECCLGSNLPVGFAYVGIQLCQGRKEKN